MGAGSPGASEPRDQRAWRHTSASRQLPLTEQALVIAGQGQTRPLRWNAACVSGIRPAQSDSICSATISISRCGNDGKVAAGSLTRSDRKFIRARALQVAYIEE